MIRWFYAATLLLTCALFVACSGASNGVLPSASPEPAPTPGMSLKLTGTMVQDYTYHYGFPSPQPPLTVRTKVTQDISITTDPAPEGYPAGSNQIVHLRETDESKLSKNTTTTDVYVAQQPKQDLVYASSTQINAPDGAQSSSSTTTYSSPRVVAKTGVAMWSNSPARKIDEVFSDGHSEHRTVATNGTYVENGTAVDYAGTLATTELQDMSSGAGFYKGGFFGCPSHTRFTFSAPIGAPAKIAFAKKSIDPYCVQAPETFPAWFEANPTFYSEADSSKQTKMPSSCGTSDGRTVSDIRSTIRFLDTIIGYFEETQSDTYMGSRGIQCVVYSDTMLIYYDWQGDTTQFVLVSTNAKPVAEVVTREILAARSGRAALPSIAVAALGRHFVASLGPQRERLRTAMIQHLVHARGGTR